MNIIIICIFVVWYDIVRCDMIFVWHGNYDMVDFLEEREREKCFI